MKKFLICLSIGMMLFAGSASAEGKVNQKLVETNEQIIKYERILPILQWGIETVKDQKEYYDSLGAGMYEKRLQLAENEYKRAVKKYLALKYKKMRIEYGV